MNWTYIGIAALLPLAVALGVTLAAGAIQAIRLNRQGGASGEALHRLLHSMALVFPVAFLVVSLWDGRKVWKGLAGVAVGRLADQRTMGLLRAGGHRFLRQDPAKAAYWYRKAAEGGDAESQLLLARALNQGAGLPRDPAEALRWAGASGNQGNADAMVLAGDLQRQVDPGTAVTWYRRAVEAYRVRIQHRDPDACMAYGLLLINGKGIEKDPVEGLAHLYLARRLGLDPFKVLIIQLSEVSLSKPQRSEAAQRALAIQKTLPPQGKS
ncbi:tetratricopeptide repeat protein [Geothrix fuzhouensis]|uniref:tetratricopeptide repeat protein n=1 Tax=Geothrix fuzhouensis TaxID=2966451 RepID=UPI0021496EE2|nr:tetratricopeptide repeat protein [Geothrix fuzhouensis]